MMARDRQAYILLFLLKFNDREEPMKRILIFLLILAVLGSVISCQYLNPTSEMSGSIQLVVNYQQHPLSLEKRSISLTHLRLIVLKDKEWVYERTQVPDQGCFDFFVGGLNPDYLYSVFLEGLINSSSSAFRGDVRNIRVTPGEVTEVDVSLYPFYPQLLEPGTNLVTSDSTVTFIWSKVLGAEYYLLSIGQEQEYQAGDVSFMVEDTTYTYLGVDRGITYYWRVACGDSIGRSGPWSEARRLLVQ